MVHDCHILVSILLFWPYSVDAAWKALENDINESADEDDDENDADFAQPSENTTEDDVKDEPASDLDATQGELISLSAKPRCAVLVLLLAPIAATSLKCDVILHYLVTS